MDVKMGTHTWWPTATEHKRAHRSADDDRTTTVSLGQRLVGFTWHDPTTKVREKVGKEVSWEVTARDGLLAHYRHFWAPKPTHLSAVLVWLRRLAEWFADYPMFRFFSSSILFCYDAAPDSSTLRLGVIDFGHFELISDGGHDDGFLFGLKQMIMMIEELQQIKEDDQPTPI